MADILDRFRFSDGDEGGNPQYQGMLAASGEWYILRIDTALNQHRYARGFGSYTDAWTGRDALDYGYFDVVF